MASFLVPLLKGDYSVTGLSRSFSCEVDQKIIYTSGDPLHAALNKSPSAVIMNYPPHEELPSTLELINQYFKDSVAFIFVGSTSIYGPGVHTETSALNTASRLYALENIMTDWVRPKTLLRPGGLFDELRHPSRFFKNKTQVQGGNLPVNMVHSKDLARFIDHCLQQNLFTETFNVTASAHPTKKQFYGQALREACLKEPLWIDSDRALGKTILNTKSLKTGFTFLHDKLL